MEFTVIDIETTSNNPRTTRVVELGAAVFGDDGRVRASGAVLVDPSSPITIGATKVHDIGERDVACERALHRAWAGLRLRTRAVVAYNGTDFDVPVLRRQLGPTDPFAGHVLFDPLIWCRWYFRALRSKALSAVTTDLGLAPTTGEATSWHGAAADCGATGRLWAWLQAEGYVPRDVDEAIELQRVIWVALKAEEHAFAGLLYWRRSDGVLCVGLGSVMGQPLHELTKKQIVGISAKKWATDDVRALCAQELDRDQTGNQR